MVEYNLPPRMEITIDPNQYQNEYSYQQPPPSSVLFFNSNNDFTNQVSYTHIPFFKIELIRNLEADATEPINCKIYKNSDITCFNEWIANKEREGIISEVPNNFPKCYINHFVLYQSDSHPKIIGNYVPLNRAISKNHFKGQSPMKIV